VNCYSIGVAYEYMIDILGTVQQSQAVVSYHIQAVLYLRGLNWDLFKERLEITATVRTRSSTTAEGWHNALCQLKSC